MEQNNTMTNEVAIITNSIEVFKTAPQVLQANQIRTERALTVGNIILMDWQQAFAIEDEEERLTALAAVDGRSNKYMGNCGVALKEQLQLRSAITQLMDKFKKMFTTTENQIDAGTVGTIPNSVQRQRNLYAAKVKEISDRKIKEAKDKANKENERTEYEALLEKQLFSNYSNLLRTKKETIRARFNTITLANFEEYETGLIGYLPQLKIEQLYTTVTFNSFYHLKDELNKFYEAGLQICFTDNFHNYKTELVLLKEELIDLLPSKKKELNELKRLADEQAELALKAANDKVAAENLLASQNAQKKIEKEKSDREAADQLKIQQEQKESLDKENAKIEIKQTGNATMAMFTREAETAEVQPTVKIKQKWVIMVLHNVGYTQLFSLWFEKSGKDLSIEKVGNTKLDQMKAWCEKHANDTGEKIESKFLQYEVDVKAVTTKEKKA